MKNSNMRKRIIMSLVGVLVTGLCVGAFQRASLGADPFTCFVTGIANLFHSTYSIFYLVITGLLLAIVFFVDKHYIGIATIFNLLIIGFAADFMNKILTRLFPAPSMFARIVMVIVGIVGTCLASSLYYTADCGVSAYDACALIAAHKFKLAPFRICRICTDCICVLVGLIFKANIGVGTVITAFFMGPLVQWFNTHLAEPFLYGNSNAEH